jgi:hypothetical protein
MEMNDEDIQESAGVLLIALRRGDGLDESAAASLKEALRNAAEAWRESPAIPKSAANLFVDLAVGIENCRYLYSGTLAEEITKLADEIGGLVRECVALDESRIRELGL